MLQSRGQKPLEFVVGGLLLFVAAAYIVELIFSRPHLPSLLEGALFPVCPTAMPSIWPPVCSVPP